MSLPKVATVPSVGRRNSMASGPRSRRALLASWVLCLGVGVVLVQTLVIVDRATPPHRLLGARHATASTLSILPAAAQSAFSATLGAESPAYRVSASGAGLYAQSLPQHLRLRFGSTGVQIDSSGLQLGMSLNGIGFGTSLQAIRGARPSARANSVVYVRPSLREWYRNGPLGLEQGFTIERAPRGRRVGLLTLSLALSGDAAAKLNAGRTSVTFNHAGARALRYGDLSATDARGHPLHSWLQLRGAHVLLRIAARGARYPLRIDPLIQQGGKLTGQEEREGAFFGDSVALSADGNTALIGGEGDSGYTGAAWVFSRSGSTWTQQGSKLVPPASQIGPMNFGRSVALSSNGDIALIGAPGRFTEAGAVWVFIRVNSTWIRGPEITSKEETTGLSFGESVALSADGETALIGDNSGPGAAWVFTYSGSTWSQSSKLTSSEGNGTFLGYSVALSADGNTALVGGPGSGAWVFTRSGSTWTQQGEKFTAGAGEPDLDFGKSVALSADGDTALVGNPGPRFSGILGGASVFTRSGSTWTRQGPELTSGESSGTSFFGGSVALSADGNTALIGGGQDNGDAGAAWVFTRLGSTWTRLGPRLTGGEEEDDAAMFGESVALSADSNTALIGGPDDSEELGAQGSRGAVWAFATGPPSATTDSASGVGPDTATLNGEVDPNGLASTAYFQYGTTTAYGQSTATQSAGAAHTAGLLAADVGGLAPETTYHFRIVAESSAGPSYGTDETFTTEPLPPVSPAPIAPVNRVAPAISGPPIRGQALSVSLGTWLNEPTSYVYKWQSCDAAGNGCHTLVGANGAAHILSQGDVGHTLRATVTAGNAGGQSSATSAPSPVVGSQVEAAMTWTFGWARRYTIVQSLVVHEIPAGSTVEVVCHGQGCPFAHDRAARAARRARCRGHRCRTVRHTPTSGEVSLTRLFSGHRLVVGAHITVNITKLGWVGKSFLFTMRANHAPRIQITCVAPGASKPGQGC